MYSPYLNIYRSGVPDGQPRLLLSLIPNYPLMNFMLVTAIYIAVCVIRNHWSFTFHIIMWRCSDCIFECIFALQVSHRLFELTNTLKTVFVPSRDNKRLVHNIAMASVIAVALYSLAFVLLNGPRMIVSAYHPYKSIKWNLEELNCVFCSRWTSDQYVYSNEEEMQAKKR